MKEKTLLQIIKENHTPWWKLKGKKFLDAIDTEYKLNQKYETRLINNVVHLANNNPRFRANLLEKLKKPSRGRPQLPYWKKRMLADGVKFSIDKGDSLEVAVANAKFMFESDSSEIKKSYLEMKSQDQ